MDNSDNEREQRKFKGRVFVVPSRVHLDADPAWVDIDEMNRHHLRNVLRLGQGAWLAVIDGSGREYACQVDESKPSRMTARVAQVSEPEVESPVKITLAQSLVKPQAFDRILTGCTELGVSRIVPVITRRSVVSVKSKDLEDKARRWRAIVQSSAAQSERTRVPQVDYPVALEDWLGLDSGDLKIIVQERASGRGCDVFQGFDAEGSGIVILTGPEGGFERHEVEAAHSAGYRSLSLGPRILRAETAALAALAIAMFRLGEGSPFRNH